MTLALGAYRLGTALLAGPIAWADARRLRAQGAPPARLAERRGHSSAARPKGPLIWVHAVSVGETRAAAGVITALAARGGHVLLTTTTADAALVARRQVSGAVLHQFAPLDTPGAVTRFLAHWRPDLAVYVESEIWPRQLRHLTRRGTPVALINARLSARSLRRWGRIPFSTAQVFGQFSQIHAQSAPVAEALSRLSKERVQLWPDLKSSAPPLPVDPKAEADLRAALSGRRVWAALSTHPGEEKLITAAHLHLLRQHPDDLLILAPRHPSRGDSLARLSAAAGLCVARRSSGALPCPQTQLYLADTLGEMGLWYRLAQVALLGGSIAPMGGHNPYEAQPFGTPILCGPHTDGFADAYDGLILSGAALRVEAPSANNLAAAAKAALATGRNATMRAAMAAQPAPDPDLPARLASQLWALVPACPG